MNKPSWTITGRTSRLFVNVSAATCAKKVICVPAVPTVPAMPLSLVRAGDTVAVARVRGGEEMRRHLVNLGFVEGSEVHVVSSSGGNIIVTIKGARFGLDAKVAQHVMVV